MFGRTSQNYGLYLWVRTIFQYTLTNSVSHYINSRLMKEKSIICFFFFLIFLFYSYGILSVRLKKTNYKLEYLVDCQKSQTISNSWINSEITLTLKNYGLVNSEYYIYKEDFTNKIWYNLQFTLTFVWLDYNTSHFMLLMVLAKVWSRSNRLFFNSSLQSYWTFNSHI